MSTFQSSWDAVSGGGSAAGTVSYDSGAAALTFGDVPPGTITRTIQFTVTGGSFGLVDMGFTGPDAAQWQVNAFNGATLDTPHNCASGDLPFAFESGSATVEFEFLSQDTGVAKTMTATFLDASGSQIDQVTATGTSTDQYRAAAAAAGTVVALYSPHLLADGSVANGAAAMEDAGGVEGDLIATLTGSGFGTWSITTSNAPGDCRWRL